MTNRIHTLHIRGKLLKLEQPVVMGIINTTPDSFYAGSRMEQAETALAQAEKMLSEGASILDIGGQSTRPGAETVGAEEEKNRVLPVIEAIHRAFPEAVISIDTYYASVAEAAVQAGAGIVNDVSAGSLDAELLATVARLQVPYVLMHMQGKPDIMQADPHYENVVQEVLDFFIAKTAECRAMGIQGIILDPGFGFGKTAAHNFRLLSQMEAFGMLNLPVLAGLSRKRTIYGTLGVTAAEALNGTTVLNTISLLHGAQILRVHDVREAMEAIKLVEACKQA